MGRKGISLFKPWKVDFKVNSNMEELTKGTIPAKEKWKN